MTTASLGHLPVKVTIMLLPMFDRMPSVHETAFVAGTATLIGAVVVQERASIWYGVVARGDLDTITVGAGSNVQDGSILHTDPGLHLRIGRDVTVGHSAVLHGCTIEDGVLVGIGARILNGAVIGERSIIAAGALVTEGTMIPPRSMVMGTPGKVVRQLTEEQATRGEAGAARYRELARAYLGQV
ncbi:gamma carbonic anhydrase family protein [Austwickia sp. TVS 96-490-7B]|uniref:gamma carbonic anhydrase family protein n=1 Tax=Austwickia sp. TVS 96-490-7B TaxID=2830843 RepID=UPI0021082055|nr:gamma carbonic anhydrase family protein [Austwickia sp. TVS 96-490-7B]